MVGHAIEASNGSSSLRDAGFTDEESGPVRPVSEQRQGTRLVAWLVGEWAIERSINDGAGAFDGTATFEPAGDGLRWQESGELALGPYLGPASRRLTVVPSAGHACEVRFDDGRLFHSLDLSSGECAVEHFCGEDVYAGHYSVRSADELGVRWDIAGPGRADTITTSYVRR